MKSSVRVTVLAAAVTLVLSGCTSAAEPPAPKPEPEVLSASEAGGIYLDAVCPVNAAWDNVDVEVDRLKLTVSRGEDDAERFVAALKKMASASKTASLALHPKTLDKAGNAWPKAASAEIAAVRDTLVADQKQAEKVAELSASEVAGYSWQDADEVGSAASGARAALGLPEDGESACAQWQEQVEAKAKAKAEANEKNSTSHDGEKSAS